MEYEIEGLSCNHCVKNVEKFFQSKGLTSQVSLADKKVRLDRSLTPTEFENFAAELDEDGYTLSESA